MGINTQEREALLQFIERNVRRAPANMDEGMGTVYERVVIDGYFRNLQARREIQTVLECPADGVTGVPGMNSLEFARNGGIVWLANPSQMMLDAALPVWKRNNLVDQARFIRCEVDDTPFDEDTFDFVWNYCMFERFQNPSALVAEMKRVSRRYVFIMTQNIRTHGSAVHKLYHAARNQEWDHGHESQMRFDAIRKALLQQGLHLEEQGALDVPPWLDTWDMPLRMALGQVAGLLGRKWEWKSESLDTQEKGSSVVSLMRTIEANLPEWFRNYQAHHLYVLARK